MEKGTKRLNIVVPEELHRKMKVTAFEQGVTINLYVAEAIAEKVERDRKERLNTNE